MKILTIIDGLNKFVLGMAVLRFISGFIEITAGSLMLKFNIVSKALIINSMLAVVGPIILTLTTSIGVLGMQDKISFTNLFFIFLGVFFIIYGIKN